jgi:hypothetical protein
MPRLIEVRVADVEVCDFCSSPQIHTYLPCDDCLVDQVPPKQVSTGSWAACRECADLVAKDDWAELAARAVGIFLAKYKVRLGGASEREFLVARVRAMHQVFIDHRQRLQ